MTVHYVPNVLTAEQIPCSKPLRPTVSMVGRIGAQKDPGLFAAVARACAADMDFTWVGDGDPHLKQQLLDAGVTVSGWVDPREARRLVASSDLYLHTGSWESAPISAMEAAAAGVPVIARRIPTMESLGYFTAPESPTDLARAVQRFFTDEVFQHTVSLTTSNMVGLLTADEARRSLENAYTDACKGQHSLDARSLEGALHEN
jgi:glycosyltransferase involved in cell wall biosynthesis